MTEVLPDIFPPDVRDEAIALIETARERGWLVGSVRITGDPAEPIITFTGKSENAGFCFSCDRSVFIERLTTLFSK
jgi:hypothetical protein